MRGAAIRDSPHNTTPPRPQPPPHPCPPGRALMALDLIFGVSNLGEEESVFIRSWQTMFSEPRTLRALILWQHAQQGRWLGGVGGGVMRGFTHVPELWIRSVLLNRREPGQQGEDGTRRSGGDIAASKVCHSDVNHSQGPPPCPGGLNSVTSLSTPLVNAEQVPRPTPRRSGRGGISHFEGR